MARQSNNLGTAELARRASALGPLRGKDGFLLGKGARLSMEKSFEHLALIGPTGSGKSTSFFIPNILDMSKGTSAVVTDPKGELHHLTKDYLTSRGFNPIKVAPLESDSMKYNPLFVTNTIAEIKELAQIILMNGGAAFEQAGKSSGGNAEWLNMSLPLLSASFIYEKQTNPNNPNIGTCIDRILEFSLEEMEILFSRNEAARQEFNIFMQVAGSEKTMSSIKITLATNVQLFLDEQVREFISRADINPKMLREGDRPLVLFVSVPETKSLYMSPLMAVMYHQLINKCQEYLGPHKRPVLYFLDEFANIGLVPGIDTVAATARSRKMALSIGLQGVEQLEANYGKEKANSLLNNLKTKIFLSGLSMESCRFASDMCGDTTIEMESKSQKDNASVFELLTRWDPPKKAMSEDRNTSKSFQQRKVLTPDEIRRIPQDENLIIAHHLQPVMLKKVIFYKIRRYKVMVGQAKPLNEVLFPIWLRNFIKNLFKRKPKQQNEEQNSGSDDKNNEDNEEYYF